MIKSIGLDWLVASALVQAFSAFASCFPDAVPSHTRRNIAANELPIGIYSQDWDSAELLARVILVLITERIGFNAIISGHGPSSRASLMEFVGCVQNGNGLECPPGPYPRNHPHHVVTEVWIDATDDMGLMAPERNVELIDVGYDGEDGPYVPFALLQKAQQERGMHLEYYSELDARWNSPWEYFATYKSINVTMLKACNLTVMGQLSMMASVIRWTPDPGGFDIDGTAFCPDGYWWLSPQCRESSSKCVPYLTGGDGWRLQDIMQRAIAYNLPLAVTVAANWGNYTSIPFKHDVLVYSWEPSMHFLAKDLQQIVFPPTDFEAQELRDFRTATRAVPLKNVVNGDLGTLAPEVHVFLQNIRLSAHDIHSLMHLMATRGDYLASVCTWLSNDTSWRTWIPDPTECTMGQGLTSLEAEFVFNMTTAVSCAPCSSGRFSHKLVGTIARVCTPCRPGTVQPMWGMDSCNFCAEGYFGGGEGLSACERCGKGTYSSRTGATKCADCPAGKTTDGTGLTSAFDCGCPPLEYLDSNGSSCVHCGEGMTCNGFDAQPRADPGYQLSQCGGDFCVFQCRKDVLRCPGGELHQCAAGRRGVACGDCEVGKRPGSDSACHGCSDGDISVIVVAPLFLCAFSGALYCKNIRAVHSSSPGIFVVFLAMSARALSLLQTLAALSTMNIGWSKPANDVLQSFSVVAFEIDWVPFSCVGDLTVTNQYVLRCMVVPCCIGFLFLIHIVFVIFGHCSPYVSKGPTLGASRPQHKRHLTLRVSIFDFVMLFLFSIAATFLSPFRCQVNPNGLWTMVEYESQICWQGYDHAELIIVASALVFLPLGFFAYIAWVLQRLASKLLGGDVDYLRAHDFLFARIRPHRLWFAFVVALRHLGFAILLVLPKTQWQAFTMGFILVLYSLVVIKAEPWRFSFLNVLDTFLGFGVLVILACVFTRMSADDSIEIVAVISICILMFSMFFFFAWNVLKRLVSRKRTFRFYLCYHKQSVGAMARLLHMYFCRTIVQGNNAVCLSADHLSRLDVHLWWIQNDTRTFLVFLTSRMFHDPWCLGEIATAVKHRVRTRLLYLPSFVWPEMAVTEAIIGSDYDSILTRHGIRISEVKQSVSHLLTLFARGADKPISVKNLETFLNIEVPRQLGGSFVRPDASTLTSLVPSSSFPRIGSKRTQVYADGIMCVLLHDSAVEESFASTMLLKQVLRMCSLGQRTVMRFLLLDFTIGFPDEILSSNEIVLLACFTHGCLRSSEFIFGLIMCSSLRGVLAMLPIVIPDDFQYPTEEMYKILLDDVALFCARAGLPSHLLPDTLNCVIDFTKATLNKTAWAFSVSSDQAMLRVQTKAIWRRIATALQHEDPIATTEVQQELFHWASTEGYRTLQCTPVERAYLNLDRLDANEDPYKSEENESNLIS